MEGEHEEVDQASADAEAQMLATMEKMDEVAPDSAELARDQAAIDTGTPLEAAPAAEPEPKPADQPKETPAAPAADAKPKVEPSKVPDDDTDLDKLDPGPNVPKKERIKWDQFKAATKASRAETRAIRAEFAAFKEEAAKRPAADPETAKKLERLAHLEHLEFLMDPEKSAVITGQFDGKLKAADGKIRGILAGIARAAMPGASEEDVTKEVSAYIGDKLERRTADEWLTDLAARAAEGKLSPAAVRRAEGAILEYFDTLEARKEAIAKAPQEKKAYEEKLSKEQEAAKSRVMAEAQAEFDVMNEKDLPDWAKIRDVPANATSEEKAAIEKANAYVNDKLAPVYAETLKKIWGGGPRAHVRVAAEAVRAHHFEAETKRLAEELAGMKQALAIAQGKVVAVKKAGQVSRAVAAPSGPVRANETMDLEKSLNAAFADMEG